MYGRLSRRGWYAVPGLMALCLIWLAGCATLIGPREVKVPLAKLQSGLDQRFPFNQRYLEVFDVSVDKPALSLNPMQQRIQLDFKLTIAPPLTNKRLSAGFSLTGGLKIDSTRRGLMLVESKIESLRVDGVDANGKFGKLGSFIADRIFRDTPLYRYKEEDLRVAGVQFVPVAVVIREQDVVINLEPMK